MLALAATSSVETLTRLGQWPLSFVTLRASLVITGPTATPVTIHTAALSAVLTPGLYAVRDGMLVGDPIELAGGPRPDADLTYGPVESALTDGESIAVHHGSARLGP